MLALQLRPDHVRVSSLEGGAVAVRDYRRLDRDTVPSLAEALCQLTARLEEGLAGYPGDD